MSSTQSDVMQRLGRNYSALVDWIDARFPMTKLMKEHATEYYASKNFNFWYGFGILACAWSRADRFCTSHNCQRKCWCSDWGYSAIGDRPPLTRASSNPWEIHSVGWNKSGSAMIFFCFVPLWLRETRRIDALGRLQPRQTETWA